MASPLMNPSMVAAPNAAGDFNIDPDYNPANVANTPAAVLRQRAMADALMKQGQDSSPAAGGKWGGLATIFNRGLAGAIGGYENNQATQQENTGRATAQQHLAAALVGGKVDPTALVAAAGDPWANPAQTQAITHVGDMQAQQARDAQAQKNADRSYGLQAQAASRANAAADRANMTPLEQAQERAPLLQQYGIDPASPEGKTFLITGKLPDPDKNVPNSVGEYNFYLKTFQPTPELPKPMDYGTFSTAKARAAASNVSVNTATETEQDKGIGKARGEMIGEDIKAGGHSGQKLRQLATLDSANTSGGDDISSGPFGKAILNGKQALSELAGVDVKGLPESEVIQKVGFGLATNMAKAISNRPSQMEFGKALENVPGLFMSKVGRTAMTSILTQEAKAERDIGILTENEQNHKHWQSVKDKYYEEHPLISPFTGKPFGEADIQMLTKGAAGAPAAGSVPAPAQPRMEKKVGNMTFYTKPDDPTAVNGDGSPKWFHD